MKNRIELLIRLYNDYIAAPTKNELVADNRILRRLLVLYHINRYIHIIDMDLMKDFNESTPHLHKINGLLTSMTVHKIFSKDVGINKKEYANELKYHTSIPDTDIYGKHSSAALGERDIIFIRTLIQRIAYIFKDIYLVKSTYSTKESNIAAEKRVKLIIDYEKAYNMFCAFEKDVSILTFLTSSLTFEKAFESIKTLVNSFTDCYQLIYDDLIRKANENV